jgi:outer membrane protein OmpA-like peptidoglycan-associated protein
MKTNRRILGLAVIAVVFLFLTGSTALAQDNVRAVQNGQRMEIKGYVTQRASDTFTMRDANGVDTVVLLTSSTDVKTFRRGVFHGHQPYAVTYILRGLRLQAKGVGNADGQLVAREVRFDETDVRTASSLETRVAPTEKLAASNEQRITSSEQRISASEENQRKLASQIDETQALIAQVRAEAAKAQAAADEANRLAGVANNRINGLDTYETAKTSTVYFKTGSAVLLPKAKAELDATAEWAKSDANKGWIVEVLGYADARGGSMYNRKLSERRANAVIDYLVRTHNLPMHRVVQPFGWGADKPIAENTTSEGRSKNRRVEIIMLVNKGITTASIQ